MMPENNIKENLSKTYIRAICSKAGYGIASDEQDYGSDMTAKDVLRRESGRFVYSGFNLDIQIKSTCNCREDKKNIIYDVRNKNYNDLVSTDNNATQKILIVFIMPKNPEDWLNQDTESLVLKKCAYWIYLGGKQQVQDNESTTAVKIPKENVFSVEALNNIMSKIKSGENLL